MSKKIIFCADGTWEKPKSDTNVIKMYRAITQSADQISFYDPGVGTDGNPIDWALGGVVGEGLLQKIRDGYTKIANAYTPGDEIFIFGFSRGAYTARSLAGMIAICGLPTANLNNNLTDAAFKAYRNRDHIQRSALLDQLNRDYAMFDARIKMVGVWDTVGSLGIPAVVGGVDPIEYGFLDTNLHPDVSNAFQALAIDERRREFPPTLWTSSSVPGQVLEQVWFSGVHDDVGGGLNTGLTDITLSWMLGKARNLGLRIDEGVWTKLGLLDAKYALDQFLNSWNLLCLFPKWRTIASNSSLSNSVAIRCEHENSYRPKNLNFSGDELASCYRIMHVLSPPPI